MRIINPTNLSCIELSRGAPFFACADDNYSNPNEPKIYLENKEHESENIFEPLFNSYVPTISMPAIPMPTFSMPDVMQG